MVDHSLCAAMLSLLVTSVFFSQTVCRALPLTGTFKARQIRANTVNRALLIARWNSVSLAVQSSLDPNQRPSGFPPDWVVSESLFGICLRKSI
jgi:hypothetical protein